MKLTLKILIFLYPALQKKTEEAEENQIELKSTKSKTTKTNMNKYKSFQDINNLLDKKIPTINNMIENIKDQLIEIENNSQLLKKKRRRGFDKKISEAKNNIIYINGQIEEENNNIKSNFGRKISSDTTERPHNKTSEDNIIKKIKGHLLKYLVIFVNNLLNNPKDGIKNLDYKKYINHVKIDNELELLQKQIKDVLSLDISPKCEYKNFGSDWNVKIIQSMLHTDDEKKEIFNFVLNLKFIDWIHLFTLEEKVSNLLNLNENDCEKIKNKMPKIEKLFEDILNKNQKDVQYLAKFIFLLYNYENWFNNKTSRTIKKNKTKL